MPDYTKTKIYRIVCDDTGEQYVGSTIQDLSKRLGSHLAAWRLWKKDTNKYSYYTSFPLLERGKYRILLIENYSCASKAEKEAREYYWIQNIEGGCVNKVHPTRTKQEYREEHKEEMKEYQKIYRQENKEELDAKKRVYLAENREAVVERKKAYYEANKDQILEYHKVYAKENKEHIQAYKKQYREENQEKIRAHAQIDYECECGATIKRVEKARHERSKKHQAFILQNKTSSKVS